MVPDLVLICENMLMAEGFVQAKTLASKFHGLYSLLQELLSKQVRGKITEARDTRPPSTYRDAPYVLHAPKHFVQIRCLLYHSPGPLRLGYASSEVSASGGRQAQARGTRPSRRFAPHAGTPRFQHAQVGS